MPGEPKLTIDQVALMAGVSRSVVSRVLNNHPKVSDEARRKVLRVIEAHDYRPSSVARSLAIDRSYEICLVTPRRRDEALATGFWPLLQLGISEGCFKRGYFVSLAMITPDPSDEISRRILNERAFDGYILITQEVTESLVPRLRERRVPMVLIGRDPSLPDVSSIDVDNYDGSYRATRHLLGLGHRRIGAILGSPTIQETNDRRSGWLQALVDAGHSPHDNPLGYGTYSPQSGFEIMSSWIARADVPDAVFCGSDAIATGVLLALYKARLAVPEQVAVVGFDDVPTSRYTAPPLTTVRQPIYDKGVRAATMLIDQIEGRTSAPMHVRLPADLVIRDSTRR
jgi:DNA-binding LacI/PurR family transcriptional regulator